jgi:acetyl-CoA/propionyl-CoA carboxylase biotin carboxyl carrier protein
VPTPPFNKVLVANRGEIAIRVMRTCRELDVATVAVYSELDRDAAHVRYADEAYALGGQTATESYLNTDAIIDVITRSGAEAVHPGYGFFAENADFARAITDRDVTWIGPPPDAIEIMGDKISARTAAAAAGVEAVPGTLEPITSADQVVAFGEQHGWPVAIKAAFGGGGRGMKVVDSPDEASRRSTRPREQAYFGRPETYLERYLTRHDIEIRCSPTRREHRVARRRDCSTQRRHQKLIEETPPGLADDVRRNGSGGEGGQGVRLRERRHRRVPVPGRRLLVPRDEPRLQVEHCVTEMVTSLDLVAEQLGGCRRSALVHARIGRAPRYSIECRINAEDPAKNFLPSPGTITRLRVPAVPACAGTAGTTRAT